MPKILTRMPTGIVRILCFSFATLCLNSFFSGSYKKNSTTGSHLSEPVILENDTLKISVERESGCFTVIEKITGHTWNPDPWEHAAGLLTLIDSEGKKQSVNLSNSKKIEVRQKKESAISIKFTDPVYGDGKVAKGVMIGCELGLDQNASKLDVQVIEYASGDYILDRLSYPSRQFSLKTDVDRGAAVIPQKQGIICPSYIIPMNGGRFCKWDDATYNHKSEGVLPLYGNSIGLSMPWWGTYNEKSAVMGILDIDSEAEMGYNINNNGQYLFTPLGKMSPFERIIFLDPVWRLDNHQAKRKISYHFIPGGNYVEMAKTYRKEAIERGYFISLMEKAEANPNVNRLAGAVYIGIYGGYPHYVNLHGMAFTFDRLKEIIKVCHDELNVENAFVHAWGTFSNYPPNCWPISEELGGVAKLKDAVDLAKNFGYLYSSYHAYTPLLENDPDFSVELMGTDKAGKLLRTGSRWARVESKYYKSLACKNLENEIEALDLEADITDIAFVFTPDSGRIELAKYLRSLNLVMGTEHGQEHWIPYFDMFEGMTYATGAPLSDISKKAPLFNLVYHDAVANFGKIQDPDNEITSNGDFRVKTLRNLLYGAGPLIFFSPYEFEGMHDMIRIAAELVSPVHRETFFAELLFHKYLSPDFKVQQSRFSNGTEVIVNLGPVAQKIGEGETIPGYGFQVTEKNGTVKSGQFEEKLDIN